MSSHQSKIWAKLLSTQYEREGNYTKYIYTINTLFTQWTIEKRYSDFEKLHKELKKHHEQDVPELPSKIFWKKNSEDKVTKRSQELEVYLDKLLSQIAILFSIAFIQFINIDEDTLRLIKKTKSFFDYHDKSLKKHTSTSISDHSFKGKSADTSSESNSFNFSDNVYNELFKFNRRKSISYDGQTRVIEEFLKDLEENKESQVEIVNAFEEFFDDQTEELFSYKEILLLLRGNMHQKNVFKDNHSKSADNLRLKKPVNGVLYHIGNYSKNLLGSLACLQFLLKLIRFDENYDSERYVKILKSIEIKYLSMMKLNEIVKSSHGLLAEKSFQLIRVFIDYQFEIEKVFNYNDYVFIMEQINNNE